MDDGLVPDSICIGYGFAEGDPDLSVCDHGFWAWAEPDAEACGAPFATDAACVRVYGTNETRQIAPQLWTHDDAAFAMLVAASEFGLPHTAASTFYDASVNGIAFAQLDSAGLRAMGFKPGEAEVCTVTRNQYLDAAIAVAPSEELWDFNRRFVPDGAQPTNISVLLTLLKLIDVDQATFDVGLEFEVLLTWEDDRIALECQGAGADGKPVARYDVCGTIWSPELQWSPVLTAPSIVDDSGLYTLVGESAHHVDFQSPSPYLRTSLAWRSYRVIGTFMGNLDFRRFPRDTQQMNVTISLPAEYTTASARLRGSAAVSVDLQEPPVWLVRSIRTTELTKTVDVHPSHKADEGDPLMAYLNLLSDVGFNASVAGPQPQLVITIEIERIAYYYWWTYVVMVGVLVGLAFLTFCLSADMIEARLSLSLTVVLAINVFQIVLFDKTPDTGYLTDIHLYTIIATIIVSLVSVESLFMYELDKRVANKKAAIAHVRSKLKTKQGRAAASVILRYVLAFLRRQRWHEAVSTSVTLGLGRATGPHVNDRITAGGGVAVRFDNVMRHCKDKADDRASTASRRRKQRLLRWRRWQERASMWAHQWLDYTCLAVFPLAFAVAATFCFV